MFFGCLLAVSTPIYGQQNVFLDFDSGTDGSIVYTTAMRNDIEALMTDIYADFDVSFSSTVPTSGQFSTLTFNSGNLGGLADAIDFRNLDQSDNAVINVDGIGFTSTADIVGLSANIAAHEFGHLMGLRHRDAFGPIGSGVIPGQVAPFFPDYPGTTNADEFGDHTLATPAFGADIARFVDPTWLSERSAIRLSLITQGNLIDETALTNNTIADAQALNLEQLLAPNTIVEGDNAGLGDFFDVDNVIVEGTITAGDVDVYSFEANEGDLFNFEVISSAVGRLDSFDTTLSIFDETGAFVDYYGVDAFNDDEIETLDSTIIDLFLPTSGTFFVQVTGFDGADSGEYELLFTRFNGIAAVPEPSALLGLAMLAGGAVLRRRRT